MEGAECLNWRDSALRKPSKFEGKAWNFKKEPLLKTPFHTFSFDALVDLRFSMAAAGYTGLFMDLTIDKRMELKTKWPDEQNELIRAFLYYRWSFAYNDTGLREIFVLIHYLMSCSSSENLLHSLKTASRMYMWDVKYARFDRAIYTIISKFDFPISCDKKGKLRLKYFTIQEIELTYDLLGRPANRPKYTISRPSNLTTKFTFE